MSANEELVVVPSSEVTVIEPRALTFVDVEHPSVSIQRIAELATEIDKIIQTKNLFTMIKQKKHVRVEAWTLCGSLVGVFPVLVSCEPCVLPDKKDPTKFHHGFTAFVEARTIKGEVVGASRAYCMRSESTWAARDDYAVASMAQTRATSKALRQPLGFIIEMAGYNATPLEEIPQSAGSNRLDRMIARVGQLCVEIDKIRGVETGTTWGIADQEAILQFETPIDRLTEDDMAVLGTALSRYSEEVKKDKTRDFQIFGGDEIFASTDY